MIIEGLHEKGIFTEQYPFRLVIDTTEEFQYPMHWHNAVELAYNISGTCRINISGTGAVLEEGDILLIPPGEIHEISSSGMNGKRCFIQFNITALDGFGGINDVVPLMENILVISKNANVQLQRSVEECIIRLIEEYEKKDYAYALSLNARIFDIIVLISRSLAPENRITSFHGERKNLTYLKQINRAFEYIEKNFASKISLKDASKTAGFSEFYFSRIFKEYTGQNFQNYLSSYRIKQAEKLLKSTQKPILDIALESGFNSLTTFNRIFKKIKGCSPKFYRRACL